MDELRQFRMFGLFYDHDGLFGRLRITAYKSDTGQSQGALECLGYYSVH